jgi:hypothetical protein
MCKDIPTDLSPNERLLQLFDKSLLVSNARFECNYDNFKAVAFVVIIGVSTIFISSSFSILGIFSWCAKMRKMESIWIFQIFLKKASVCETFQTQLFTCTVLISTHNPPLICSARIGRTPSHNLEEFQLCQESNTTEWHKRKVRLQMVNMFPDLQ